MFDTLHKLTLRKLMGASLLTLVIIGLVVPSITTAQEKTSQKRPKSPRKPQVTLKYPPKLPGEELVVTDTSEQFLQPPEGVQKQADGSYKLELTMRSRRPRPNRNRQQTQEEPKPPVKRLITFTVAKTPPTVDFTYYPGQDYRGKPWSVWGDGTAVGDVYYSAIGDHMSPKGTARIFRYDPKKKELRRLVDLKTFLVESGAIPPEMDYTPGKVHTRITMGSDGWLYYATHRGSPRTTNDEHGYKGDWVYRTHPETGETEIVAAQPVPKHAIPAGFLDPKRMIFYGGTAQGSDAEMKGVHFFAYDVKNRKLLKVAPNGFKRNAILSNSTGKVYFDGKVYDPETNEISECPEAPSVRSSTAETPDGMVYGTTGRSVELWGFNVKTEKLTRVGHGGVGESSYTTTIDADPSGRYLYYIPGAHGGSASSGTAVIQYDLKTKTKKVIAFLAKFYQHKYGYTLDGTFGSALSESGDKLYVTWNGQRIPHKGWECCAMTVIHIPESERLR